MGRGLRVITACIVVTACLPAVSAYGTCCSCYDIQNNASACDSAYGSEQECSEACYAGGWQFYIWQPDFECAEIGGWWMCVDPDQRHCCECVRDGTDPDTACYEGGFDQFACEVILPQGIDANAWDACEFHAYGQCLPDDTCGPVQLSQGCCFEDGQCGDMYPQECAEAGGQPQGPGTGCVDCTVACCLPDGSCLDTDPLCCDDLGGLSMGCDSHCATTTCAPIKWIQLPDVTENGIDIALGRPQNPLRILADDFQCNTPGVVTDVTLWGSWLGDEVGRITRLQIEFLEDDPPGPAGLDPANLFPQPGEPLWQREFFEGQFSMEWYATVLPGEWWWDPPYNQLTEHADQGIWQINVHMADDDAFYQRGTTAETMRYWIAVRAETENGEFGWKTREWPHPLNDAAVWDYGSELPRLWKELRYPPGHPYHGLERDAIDLSFALTTKPAHLETKWEQFPHHGGEGFDAASGYAWREPPKWEQLPDPWLSGIHAHDWNTGTEPRFVTTLADDWICGGGHVVKVEWWGNYQIGTDGQEMRGSGVGHFHLSVHNCAGGDPFCLPMEPEMYGFDVPFTAALEQPTGLVNVEGSPIYRYEFLLPIPVPQQPMMHYWFDVTAMSNDATDPAMWRWQEAKRDFSYLGWAPAAKKTTPPTPGVWQTIIWPTDQFSDMAFRLTSADLDAVQEVNKIVADDFISDGRPIEGLVWWGSYLDDQYAPAAVDPTDPYVLDGWMITFHYNQPEEPCPPEIAPADIPTVLGAYFAPADAVEINPLFMVDCFGHPVYMYEVDLAKCCLLCAEPDPRLPDTARPPAGPASFDEEAGFEYWLGIQAIVGVTWDPPYCGYDDHIATGHLPSPVTNDGQFWGWHTSPDDLLNEACTGKITNLDPYPPDCWEYGEWEAQPWLCDDVPAIPPVNMAFLLKAAPTMINSVASCSDHALSVTNPQPEWCIPVGQDPITGEGQIDPRLAGVDQIEFRLSAALNPATAIPDNVQISCTNMTGYDPTIMTALIDPVTLRVGLAPGLPDEDCCKITLDGMLTLTGRPVHDVTSIRTLRTDTDSNGAVLASDMLGVKTYIGQYLTIDNVKYDMDGSGTLLASDMLAVKAFIANTAPDCP